MCISVREVLPRGMRPRQCHSFIKGMRSVAFQVELKMELLQHFFQFIMHLDQHLVTYAVLYGTWIYAILFIIIFCETGLVVTPFLPGDSLLFATGAIAAKASTGLHIHLLFILLVLA